MTDTNQTPNGAESASDATGARLILILGGARSGKSTFAEKLAASSGRSVAFLATATAGDEEMRARIARHQAERSPEWHTIEEPLDLVRAMRHASELADVILLDCLTLWTSNLLMQHLAVEPPSQDTSYAADQIAPDMLFGEKALREIEELLAVLHALPACKTVLVISNEVGLGLVPEYPLGRVYRDTLGYINQRLARASERVYLLVAGIAVDLKRFQEEALWS